LTALLNAQEFVIFSGFFHPPTEQNPGCAAENIGCLSVPEQLIAYTVRLQILSLMTVIIISLDVVIVVQSMCTDTRQLASSYF